MEDYEPVYYDDVEEARNRPDKSMLAIKTMCPEKLLASDVAFPEQVKHLWLHLSYDYCDFSEMEKYLYKQDCDCPQFDGLCNKCSWYRKYTDTLCKDLVNFNHLETLILYDVNLSSELWSQFAKNSTCLKEIIFSSNIPRNCGDDRFNFDEKDKIKGLEDVLKIQTLEKVKFHDLKLPFFPKGPSNVKHIELDRLRYDYSKQQYDVNLSSELLRESFYNNFSTHTQLTFIDVDVDLEFSVLQLEKLKKLEYIEFYGNLKNQDDIISIRAVLDLPNLKKISLGLDYVSFNSDWLQNKNKMKQYKEKLDHLYTKFEIEKNRSNNINPWVSRETHL
jgi:hypothetical protein